MEWTRDFIGIFTSHAHVTADEIATLSSAKVNIGVATVGRVVFAVHDIGGMNGESPYNVHLLSPESRPELTVLTQNERLLAPIFLIDSSDGTVCAIRVVTMSERVSQALRAAVSHQLDVGHDSEKFKRDLLHALVTYSTKDLLRMAVIDEAGQD